MADKENGAELEYLRHALASRQQLRQATMNFEHAGLKILLLLNGGGLIPFIPTTMAVNAPPYVGVGPRSCIRQGLNACSERHDQA